MKHDLKCWPQYFEPIRTGLRPFEIRLNDRGYHPGDTLNLREWDPAEQTYTGRTLLRRVSHLSSFEQQAGYVVMGLQPVPDPSWAEGPEGEQKFRDYIRARPDLMALLAELHLLDILDAHHSFDSNQLAEAFTITNHWRERELAMPVLHETLLGEWTPRRCLHLGEATQITELCKLLNGLQG